MAAFRTDFWPKMRLPGLDYDICLGLRTKNLPNLKWGSCGTDKCRKGGSCGTAKGA